MSHFVVSCSVIRILLFCKYLLTISRQTDIYSVVWNDVCESVRGLFVELCVNQITVNVFCFACRIKMHEQRRTKQKDDDKTPQGAVPAYLLDREGQSRAKVLSNMIKQKRKEKAVSPVQSHGVK